MSSAPMKLPSDEVSQQLLCEHHNSSAPVGSPIAGKGAQASEGQPFSYCTGLLLAAPRRVWDSGLTCAFLASLIFSISALCVKLTGGRIPVLEVCFVRSSLSFLLTVVLMKSTGISPVFGQRSNLRLLFMRGCCGACSMTSYYVGLFLLPLGDAVTIGLIGPAVTAIAARLFLKEPLGHRGMLGCLVSMAGVIVLSKPPFLFGGQEWDRGQALGTVATVLSAFLGAGSSMTIRLIGNREPAAVIAMWFHTCTMILTFIPLAFGVPAKMALMASKDFGLMLGVACTSFVAQLLSTRGLQMVVAAKAAAMGFTQVFYSYVMGAIFFGERITTGGLMGVFLILIGVLMVTMRSSRCKTSSKPATNAAQQLGGALGVCKAADISPGDTAFKAAASIEQATAAGEAIDKLPPSYSAQAGLLSLAAASALEEEAQTGVDAAVLIKATSNASALSSQLVQSQAGSSMDESRVPATGSLQSQPSTTAVPDAVVEADLARYLAAIAAQAAAALGGELCPATAASVVASRQASFCTALQLSRAASSRVPGIVDVGNPSPVDNILSRAPSVFRPQDSAALTAPAASNAIDIPRAAQSHQPTFSRQVSGWLAANLLATPPADCVLSGTSYQSYSSITAQEVVAQEAAVVSSIQSPVRLTEALLQDSASPSPCSQRGHIAEQPEGPAGTPADGAEAAAAAADAEPADTSDDYGPSAVRADCQLLKGLSGELQ